MGKIQIQKISHFTNVFTECGHLENWVKSKHIHIDTLTHPAHMQKNMYTVWITEIYLNAARQCGLYIRYN